MVVSVEEVSSSLVREYLSRKGLRRTAACMDEESPRTETSINNRSQLRRTLDLDGLYRENKVQGSPLKTLLEIMVKYHIAAPGDDRKASGGRDPLQSAPAPALTPTPTPPATPAPAPAFSPALSPAPALSPDPAPSSAPTPAPSPVTPTAIVSAKAEAVMSKHAKLRSDIEDTYTPSFPETDGLSGCDQSGCWAYRPGETRGPPLLAPVQYKESFRRREPEKKTPVTESTQRNRSNRIRRGMMAGPIASTPQETNKKRQSRRIEVPRALLRKEEQQRQWRDGFPPNSSESSRAEINSAGEKQQLLRASHSLKTRKVKSRPNVPDLEVSEMVLDDFDDEDDLQELSKVSFDRTVAEHSSAGHPIGQRAVVELKELLLGSSLNCFSIEWRNQGFTFSETHDLRYGIVQKKGGPCGVLASVQAFVLKKLLFENTEKTNEDLERLRPFSNTRRKCLVLAVAEILWRAGEEKQATVAVSGRNQFTPTGNFRSAGVLEKLTCFTVDNITDLQSLVQQHIEQFETGVLGCILLTISAILSRSIEKVREDMDVPTTTLIGAHGYCTQELVNLLLCGRAVSNVFDDDMELDSGNGNVTLLKGIKGQCDVGLLSLFEHYNICKVGAYLKTPSYPIWVVCSESHFSVLFGLQRELLTNPDRGLEFDLYYYDGLANQQEEIRLTVSVAKLDASCQDDDTDLIPPLEHCIRTRWRDAFVNWNDTEPIL